MIQAMQDVLADLQRRAADTEPPRASLAALSPHLDVSDLYVFDDLLDDPADYERIVRAQEFKTIEIGPATFHGIAACPDDALPRAIEAVFPHTHATLTFFRQSPAGQVEPNFIHTDRDMGDWTAILYLTSQPPAGDGTAFWRRKSDGAQASTARTDAEFFAEWATWRERDLWEPWHTIEAKQNRLLVFPAPAFHSRALFDGYGERGTSARLIQLVFGIGRLCQ